MSSDAHLILNLHHSFPGSFFIIHPGVLSKKYRRYHMDVYVMVISPKKTFAGAGFVFRSEPKTKGLMSTPDQ